MKNSKGSMYVDGVIFGDLFMCSGGPLHLGDIEELGEAQLPCIVCPWHSWKYSLQTGQLKVPHKKNITLGTHPVKVNETGEVYVGIKALSPDYFNGEIEF